MRQSFEIRLKQVEKDDYYKLNGTFVTIKYSFLKRIGTQNFTAQLNSGFLEYFLFCSSWKSNAIWFIMFGCQSTLLRKTICQTQGTADGKSLWILCIPLASWQTANCAGSHNINIWFHLTWHVDLGWVMPPSPGCPQAPCVKKKRSPLTKPISLGEVNFWE